MAKGLFVLDYYGPMSLPNRLLTLALVAACACGSVFGAPPTVETPDNSSLDGELFYQLLVSEMSAQSGDNGSAYALMLNAARKANSSRLYERAVEIALRARSGGNTQGVVFPGAGWSGDLYYCSFDSLLRVWGE